MPTDATRAIELPIFHLGTYTAQDGTSVTFTPELLRQMERNTKLAIRMGKFQPPVGYDHPAANSDSHGLISDVRYENGKLIGTLGGISDKLRDDAKNFRRLTYSPEFRNDFEFVHDGKPVKLPGPTCIGLAMLGAQRGAIKNSAMVPLSEVQFGEGVSEVESLLLRQDLRDMGYVGEYAVDGKMFGEVENDISRFAEKETETTMTDAEIQALANKAAADAAAAATAPLLAKIAEQDRTIKSFSETSARASDVKSFCEKVSPDKNPRFTELGVARLVKILNHPAVAADPALDADIRAFAETISPATITLGESKGGKKKDGAEGDTEEPEALARLRVKHFANRTDPQNEQIVTAAITAFSEYRPEAFKGIENNPAAQDERVIAYVRQRDMGT